MDNFIIAKATDVGRARQVNEDSMTVFDSPNGQVMAVCDGMGGQAAGDVASKLTVNIIEGILSENTFSTPEEAIRRSIVAANQGVLNRTAQNPELMGMGSTCVMLIVNNGRVHCGWVGDSRIYYISNHTIRQISHDQSYVQQLVDSGQISAAEAAVHPQKNEITNCIGLEGMTAPDTIPVPISPEPGSVFLLCSDGLSGVVDEQQIERVVSNASMSLQQRAERLVELANEAGGPDNITVQLLQFGSAESAGATSGTLFDTPAGVNSGENGGKRRSLLSMVIGICVALVLCAGGGVYYVKYVKKQNPKQNVEQTKPQKRTGKEVISPKTSEPTAVTNGGGGSSPQGTNPNGTTGSTTGKKIKKVVKKGTTPNPEPEETDPEIIAKKKAEEAERKAREAKEQDELKKLMEDK